MRSASPMPATYGAGTFNIWYPSGQVNNPKYVLLKCYSRDAGDKLIR